jgi:hypothetical protein
MLLSFPFSALATTDGAPTAWPEETALRGSARLNWLGSTLLSEMERDTDMPSVPTRESATDRLATVHALRDTKEKAAVANRARTTALAMALAST